MQDLFGADVPPDPPPKPPPPAAKPAKPAQDVPDIIAPCEIIKLSPTTTLIMNT